MKTRNLQHLLWEKLSKLCPGHIIDKVLRLRIINQYFFIFMHRFEVHVHDSLRMRENEKIILSTKLLTFLLAYFHFLLCRERHDTVCFCLKNVNEYMKSESNVRMVIRHWLFSLSCETSIQSPSTQNKEELNFTLT